MAKKNTKRKLIALVSDKSKHRTYYTTINTQNRTTKGQGRLTLRKYDPRRTLVATKSKLVKANLFIRRIIKTHATWRGFYGVGRVCLERQ